MNSLPVNQQRPFSSAPLISSRATRLTLAGVGGRKLDPGELNRQEW